MINVRAIFLLSGLFLFTHSLSAQIVPKLPTLPDPDEPILVDSQSAESRIWWEETTSMVMATNGVIARYGQTVLTANACLLYTSPSPRDS